MQLKRRRKHPEASKTFQTSWPKTLYHVRKPREKLCCSREVSPELETCKKFTEEHPRKKRELVSLPSAKSDGPRDRGFNSPSLQTRSQKDPVHLSSNRNRKYVSKQYPQNPTCSSLRVWRAKKFKSPCSCHINVIVSA